jgi:flagellar basal body-associated protein FliL
MDSQVETPITPAEEPKKSRTGLIILIVILVILCCCCGSVLLFYFWLGDILVDIFQNIFYQIGGFADLGYI